MIAAWMAYVVLWTMWLSLVAAGIERALLRIRVPVRGVWVAALVMSVAGPLLSVTIARRPVSSVVVESVPVPAAVAAVPPTVISLVPTAPPTRSLLDGFAERLAAADRPLLVAWAALTALGLICAIGGLVHLRNLRRRWRSEFVNGVSVLVSDDVGPAVVGVWRSAIVIPEWALTMKPEAVSLMLAHELEHQRSSDLRLLALARAATIGMPWNVALWWLLRRLRLAVEMDCDARVLSATMNVRLYGQLLIECGQLRRSTWLTAFAGHGTQLERRIRVMTQTPSRRGRGTIAICAVAGIAAVLVACGAPTPQPRIASEPVVDVPPARNRPARVDSSPPPVAVPPSDSVFRASMRKMKTLADSVLGPSSAQDTVPLLTRYFDARVIMDSATDERAAAKIRAKYRRSDSAGRALERLTRDSSTRPRSAPVDSAGLIRLLQMFSTAIAVETERDPDIRELRQQVLDSYRYTVDSLVRAEKGLRQLYTSEHPAVIEAQRKGAQAHARLDSLLVQRQSTGSPESTVACTAGASMNGGAVVQRLVSDDAAARAGRIVVSAEAAQDSRLTVDAGGVRCSSDAVGVIRVFGAVDDVPIVVRAARPTSVVVVSRSGKVLAGPVGLFPREEILSIPSATRRLELAWR